MRGLSIDGGGFLGVGPARLLRSLELAGYEGWEDFLTGTSVGALLVAMRLRGNSWTDIYRVFTAAAPKIFATPSLAWRMNPTTPKFDATALERVVRRELGDMRCSDAKIPFFIPVMDMSRGVPKVYDNSDSDYLSDVVLRSTAAPTYFAPRNGRWCDGGLVANNPSHLAVCAMVKAGIHLDAISMISLNTGGDTWTDPHVDARMLPTSWISPVIKSQLAGNEEVGEFICDALLPGRHLRITPPYRKDYDLADVGSMVEVSAIWAALYETVKLNLVAAVTA